MELNLRANHVTHGVYIGSARLVHQAPALRKMGLTCVLKLYSGDPYWPDDFTVCRNPLSDGMLVPLETLQRGMVFVHKQVAAGKKVLVVCRRGRSRSSTFVLAYMLERGHDLRAAWDLLRKQHPAAFPVMEMWESLVTHYNLPYALDEVLDWLIDK